MEAFKPLIMMVFFIFFMILVMNHFFRKLGISYLNPFYTLLSFLTSPSKKPDGMMNKTDEVKLFSRFNDGLLIDGKNKRLSQKESFNHLALISRAGGGKSSSFVIPNIFKLANENCSMVITDLSGELFEKTSGYLKQRGFKIYVLDPKNLNESIRYNPLEYAKDSMSIDMVSEILIASSGMQSNNANGKIWTTKKNINDNSNKVMQIQQQNYF